MDKFCKIFVSGYQSKTDLKNQLSLKFNTQPIRNEILIPDCEIYCEENDDYDKNKQKEFPDGFIYFPYILELDFTDNISIKECICIVNDMLSWFWINQKSAVAVCDYELELLNQGGFKSKIVPFPV